MATMTLSPTSAAPGATVTISGTGFSNQQKMKVAVESIPVLTFKTSNGGTFTKTIQAPGGANRDVAIVASCFINRDWVVCATATLAIVNTGPAPDTTKPVISAVASGSITQTGATITWTTNEPSTTQVEYGPVANPGYGSVTAKVSTLVTSHSQALTGLQPGTQYKYRVWSADAANNIEWSEAGAPFTTSAASPTYTAPGAPTGLTATGGTGLVDLSWTAPASNGGTAITGYRIYRGGTSIVTLGNVTSYQNTGLNNGQQYSYQVAAINAAGLEGPPSVAAGATPGDTTPPIVSGINHGSVTQTTATVSWSANEPSTGQVQYGLTTGYGSLTALETDYLTYHAQAITGLTANTLYHYRSKAVDAAGNPGYSNDRTFTTLATVSAGYPAETTLVATTPPTPPAVPQYLSPVTDPTWGTQIIRVSSVAGKRHAYSRIPGWNCDGTKIYLAKPYPGRMLDGNTYADLGSLNGTSQFIWSSTNPARAFGRSSAANELHSQNTSSGVLTNLHTFAGYSLISIGEGEGGVDDNDTYIALIATTSGGAEHLITYNIVTDTVVADIALSGMNNCQISRLGNYVVVVGSMGTRRYLRNLTSPITLTASANHGDNALDASGNEIYVANNAPFVKSFALSNGAATQLLPGTSAFEYGHVSGRNRTRNGWVYLSNYGYTQTAGRTGRDQVVAVKTDGSGTVNVFGFANQRGDGSTGYGGYEGQPQAVPSPDGQRVLFASTWNASNVYAYVARKV